MKSDITSSILPETNLFNEKSFEQAFLDVTLGFAETIHFIRELRSEQACMLCGGSRDRPKDLNRKQKVKNYLHSKS